MHTGTAYNGVLCVVCITPVWDGFPSSIARQPRGSCQRGVSNVKLCGTDTIATGGRYRAWEIDPGVCNVVVYTVICGSAARVSSPIPYPLPWQQHPGISCQVWYDITPCVADTAIFLEALTLFACIVQWLLQLIESSRGWKQCCSSAFLFVEPKTVLSCWDMLTCRQLPQHHLVT